MQLNKDDFIKSHAKAGGSKLAEQLYNRLQAKIKSLPECPLKMYLSATGGEVQVNGPGSQSTRKPETLQEKIARFDRLAVQVAASRAVMHGLSQELTDDDDIDAEDDDFADIIEKDEFGDVIGKPSVQPKAATNNASGQQSVDGDEPSQVAAPAAADPAKQSGMDDGGSAAE